MIEKAPIINEVLARGGDWTDSQVEILIELQRDADHQYYLEQFVKWLKENTTYSTDLDAHLILHLVLSALLLASPAQSSESAYYSTYGYGYGLAVSK